MDCIEGGARQESPSSNARYTIWNSDGGQRRATRESTTSNARYAIRDGDGSQTFAMNERTLSNTRHAVRNSDRGKRRATPKSIISNARYTIWNSDGGQRRATRESIFSNTCYAVRDSDGSQTFTRIERISSNTRHAVRNNRIFTSCDKGIGCCFYNRITILAAIICRIPSFYYNGSQTRATRERIISNTSHAVRNGDRSQTRANIERPISNTRHTVRDSDRSQIIAMSERFISNSSYTIRNYSILTSSNKCICSRLNNSIAITTAIIYHITIIDNYSSQHRSYDKYSITYTSYAAWYVYGLKRKTLLEGIAANSSDSLRNYHKVQRTAITKSSNPNAYHTIRDSDRGEGGAMIESLLSNACNWSIERDYTLAILVGIANDIGTKDISFVWSDDIAIGGGVEDLPCWIDGWSVFLPLGIQRTCPISRDSG